MLVRLAVIGLLLVVLWMVTKRRDSLFKSKSKKKKPKTGAWFNKRIAEWKEAMNVISSATSQGDAVAKITAARAAKPKSSVYGQALRKAKSKKNPQVPQIVAAYNKIISGLEKSKMKWVTKWLKSKKTRQLIYKEQIADAKKYGNTNDFVAAYQQKVNNLMSKSTTSTFKGEENIPDAVRVQMYQKAIGDMQKAGSVDKFVKSRQGIISKAKKAAGKAGRRKKASMVAKKSGGNYYFYFNSIK
jgi:FtsZ-interacting cell division protein ZipA